jgi:hypothetical protein
VLILRKGKGKVKHAAFLKINLLEMGLFHQKYKIIKRRPYCSFYPMKVKKALSP